MGRVQRLFSEHNSYRRFQKDIERGNSYIDIKDREFVE